MSALLFVEDHSVHVLPSSEQNALKPAQISNQHFPVKYNVIQFEGSSGECFTVIVC